MFRFSQGSAIGLRIPSNQRLDVPEKVRRPKPAWIGHPSNLLTSSNLFPPAHEAYLRIHAHVGTHTHVTSRAHVSRTRLGGWTDVVIARVSAVQPVTCFLER